MHEDSKGIFYMLKEAIYHRPKIITHTLTMKNDSHPNTYEKRRCSKHHSYLW